MGTPIGNGVMTSTGVIGPVCRDHAYPLILWYLGQQVWQHRCITHVIAGDFALGEYFVFTCRQWIARISSVSASIPTCTLRHWRGLDGPCLRVCHSPSPSALMPVLSISRCSGPLEPRYGIATVRFFWRRLRVLKSGTGQSRPANCNRLSTRPITCRSGRRNSTFSVRQVWIAASLNVGSSHGLQANHCRPVDVHVCPWDPRANPSRDRTRS